MTTGRMEDGTPFTALGNSEPIPQWMLDRESQDLGELMRHIREGRRAAGWCDHGLRVAGAPVYKGTLGQEFGYCPEGCE